MHDVVRRHATTLCYAISITVIGIAVLLIRCGDAPAASSGSHSSSELSSRAATFSRSGIAERFSRRDMIAAAGDAGSTPAPRSFSPSENRNARFPPRPFSPLLSTPYPPLFFCVRNLVIY